MASFDTVVVALEQGGGQQLAARHAAAGVVQSELLQGEAAGGLHEGRQSLHSYTSMNEWTN